MIRLLGLTNILIRSLDERFFCPRPVLETAQVCCGLLRVALARLGSSRTYQRASMLSEAGQKHLQKFAVDI